MSGFEAGDVDAAVALYRSLDDRTARAFLDLLIDHPEERFDGAAVARRLGLEHHPDVARAAYRIGQIAAAQGRTRPWNEAQLGYAMARDQAALFAAGRRQAAAETAGS